MLLSTQIGANKPHTHTHNKELSFQVHDQGTTYQCWAYSTTTMIRHSWKVTLNQMEEALNNGTWTGKGKYWGEDELEFDYNKEMQIRESS